VTRAEAITTVGLVHIYRSEGQDVAALSGVDLSVRAGEVVGLLGPSGSGKSTLLALLGGLFRPSAGKIFVGEHELSSLTAAQIDAFQARETSLMLQGAQRNLIPYLTVRENIAFAQGQARRLGADVIGVDRGLELVGATEFADSRLGHLSQGQLQMAALAVAMAPSPGVLLADEPTSALDRVARERIVDTLLKVNEEQGTTVVVVTHDPEVADRLPRTVTIRDGRIGGEGRGGQEYAVITADGFIPLPVHIREALPPGTLLRFEPADGSFLVVPEVIGHEAESIGEQP
jgi:putative ABC transport system ATP-binding protein